MFRSLYLRASSRVGPPQLIPRAAMVRRRSLRLGGFNDYSMGSVPSSSTLISAAPERTNMFILAYGRREGLACGERLEAYGVNLVRLVRMMAYGCPRDAHSLKYAYGQHPRHALEEITVQIEAVHKAQGELDVGSPSVPWRPDTKKIRWELTVLPAPAPPPHTADNEAELLRNQLERLKTSDVELVVAEWRRTPPAAVDNRSSDADDLLMENGVCYRSPEVAGLRVLRAARFAFVWGIERTSNSLAELQRRRRSEGTRPLAVLDVSALDFTFSHAAIQSLVELGLHNDFQRRVVFVPLNDRAARTVEPKMMSLVHSMVQSPGKAVRNPFWLLQARSFDIGAFTAYLDLRVSKETHDLRHELTPSLGKYRTVVFQLAQALAALRKGASMLVSIVPTPSSIAAVSREVFGTLENEVRMEKVAMQQAKACIAEAISRTGRWGYITDEVLPLVDCPQGSALSLLVILD